MNVRFFRLDRQKVEQSLRAYARQLAEDPRVRAVVLFGSFARGQATAMSDADVLILLSEWPRPFHERLPDFLRPGIGISLDVFPYTLSEASEALRVGDGVVAVAVREGLWLLDKDRLNEQLSFALDIKDKLARSLAGRPEIWFAVLYGSAAEGRSFRDLDVGIFVDRAAVSPSAELDYAFRLADELEGVVPHPVDVRVINDAPLGFRYNVSRGTALVVNDREAFARFLERTWDEYLDFQPVAMRYLKEMA